jgi:hypothetical protein
MKNKLHNKQNLLERQVSIQLELEAQANLPTDLTKLI